MGTRSRVSKSKACAWMVLRAGLALGALGTVWALGCGPKEKPPLMPDPPELGLPVDVPTAADGGTD